MTTDQEVQLTNTYRSNGDVESCSKKVSDETSTETSSQSSLPHSRFFRSKRKQRLGDAATIINGDANSNHKKLVGRTKTRQFSPSTKSLDDDGDESDESDDDEDDDDTSSVSKTAVLKGLVTEYNHPRAQANSSLVLKKSQSVKLTRLDHDDTCSKKVVRFADDFGLDLSQIKVIKTDELPLIPITAFRDLHINKDNNSNKANNQEKTKLIIYMEPQFENPLYIPDFTNRLSHFKVVLEQANAIDNRIYGTIKLISFGMHKQVRVRVTTDNWITFKDYDASYIVNSFDGIHDRFSFVIDIDRSRICAGNNIQLCICYESNVTHNYWDNNYGQNYRFDCCSRAIPDYTI